MDNNRAPRGLIVELITPLRNGGIDGAGLERLLARAVPHAQALLLAGPRHGEGENMEMALRHELLEKTVDALARRPLPLLVWVSGHTEAQTRKNILSLNKRFGETRPAGGLFWVDTPLTYHSNRGLPEYYRELLSIIKIPLVLHNDPEAVHSTRTFKRRNIRTAVLKELVQNEGIAGLVFSGSLERAHHYQRACRTRQHFRLYDGDENRFLEHPSMGGVVSVGANLAPGAWRIITQSSIQLHAHQENYPDRLQQIWESGDYLKQMVALSGQMPAAVIKTILCDMGVIETPEMLQMVEIEPDDINALKRLMHDFGDYR
ncbi:MAG: dihydrodipicolinate synthase family protein [Deltaproteobacteria bacterium]|nr:dihydrodipicolinate synthase family protein [Deltaproteobacteria bacterium]